MLVFAYLAVLQPTASAITQTNVSLDFDGNAISQYTLGYQQALQPHSASGTFYVNSGTVGASANFMSWTQLSTLALVGNDIGGKSVNATNLTTDPNPTAQVCNDRAALIQHGLKPVAFAYPGGATNATVKGIVKGCGYGNARTAGSLSPTGPTYAETLPPADWFGVRAYAPSHPTLATMESLVSGAAAHGGGWTNIVIGKICSQSLDPNNYSTCSTSSGSMELADLNSFLDWMGQAGQSGGAPAGATLSTTSSAVNPVDTSAPTTTISCNSAPCQSTPYSGIVSVSLTSTDTGSGVSSIHYTTDGSVPTLSSPTYSGPFNVNGNSQSTPVNFRAWDYAGNVEATNTQVIQAPADTSAPSTTIACNTATCTTAAYIASVSITLSATDTGGSGVAATYYTTDGSTPTTSSNKYTGAFALNTPGTYTIKYFSVDNAGNSEAVQSQQVKVVPVTTRVLLTFDNGSVSQYNLGYTQALQPHSAVATFFVNSGNIGVSAQSMTWPELTTLKNSGSDIGGKTVNATNLTTDPNPTAQVCNDHDALAAHGLDPVAFAYPGGNLNASVETIVKNCGYGSARSAGSLSPSGPTYAETAPPKDWYSTRAWAPTGQVSLSAMESLVSGAASHGGGWSQIVLGRVCSQAQDPTNYTACTATSGWIELADLNTFLDWMANAGSSGGAPAGAQLSTVRAAAIGADTSAPSTTASCDGSACASTTYTSTVHVALSATDTGSAVASTHYTLDGSAPTLSSPTYTKPIPITQTTTITYASWDRAGNAEAPNTLTINANLPSDTTAPTTTILCDGSPCALSPDGGYNGKTTITLSATDGNGWGVAATYYTIDGTTPTTSSATYSSPFALSTPGTYTVQTFSVDLAGNTESVESQQVVVLAPKVVVSITFDDGLYNQYALGYLQALKPHHMHGTFYNISGMNNVDPQHMTWDQLTALNNGGNEIGGHTVDHVNLKTDTDPNHVQYEVCQDRQNLINHGFDPTSFAYPEGAYNATAESIVQGCGYSTGRAAGGIDVGGEGAGPVYAETLPPKDMFATRTGYDPPSGNPPNVPPLSLSHLEAQVNAAAQNGGGWLVVVLHQVCSQTLDPDNYASCIADWGPIELSTLNSFLDWLQATGKPGGAPARTAVQTVRQTLLGPDTQAPVTALDCDGSPCQASTYNGSTLVSFAAHDPGGSGVAATYYTTDGTTPTTSSSVYSKPFTISTPTTFKYFSVDNSGNVEPVQTLQVNVAPNPDPVIGAAGDIACDPNQIAFNDAQGTDTDCRAIHTVKLLHGVDAVLPLGDDQYYCGGTQAFAQSYDPTWGMVKSITRPVPGDQDYNTSGGTDCPTVAGAGYFQYFGSAAGDPSKGYYSYNLGQWHVVAINTAPCGNDPTFCAAGSAQDQWLQQDLAAHPSQCTLAYYQNPRWVTGTGATGNTTYQAIWQDLYNGGADVVLNGDSHWYERFAPMNGSGQADPTRGVREFIVGTGGQGLDTPTGAQSPNSQVLDDTTHGVIRMTLHAGSYDWSFVPDEGTFTDSGTATCHSASDTVAPTSTVSCNNAACGSGFYGSAVTVGLSATDNTGGSGVDKIYYTTNGTTPTTASTVYSAPFQVSTTSTVKYFAVDKSGNAEAVKSQQVQIDSSPPTTTIACNGSACASTPYTNAVSVTLSATDGTNSSGVSAIRYTTDGTAPTTASPAYTGPITVSKTTTIEYRAWDVAGNAEATKTTVVPINDSPPAVAFTLDTTSGVVPFTVKADASGSKDTDVSPISSYQFNWGDGTAAVTQSSPVASHNYTKAGTFTVTVTVTDTANLSASSTKSVTAKANVVTNSGFESNLTGWKSSTTGVALSRVAGGHSGSWAARLTNNNTTAATAGLADSPGFVPTTSAGTYTAGLWVKGATAGATLKLALTERAGVVSVGSATSSVTLSTSWQFVTVSYTVKQPGLTSLGFSATVAAVPPRVVAFYADDAVLSR